MADLFWLIAAVVGAWSICAGLRRVPVAVGLAVFLLVPVVLGALWAGSDHDFSWFQWAKVYSVAVAAAGAVAMRTKRVEAWGWGGAILVVIFVLNILEAVVAEAAAAPGPNVLAGLLLLLTLPGAAAVHVDRSRGRGELRYELTVPWVLGYTLWNFAFVYGANIAANGYGASAGFAVAHLAAALVATGGQVARWGEARAFTLAVFMFWRFTFPDPPLMIHTPQWYVPEVALALATLSLLVACVLVVGAVRRRTGGIAGRLARWIRIDVPDSSAVTIGHRSADRRGTACFSLGQVQ